MQFFIALMMTVGLQAHANDTLLNLKAPKVLKTSLFSIIIPKGWSYQTMVGIHDTTHLAKNNRHSRSFFTQDLLITPNSNLLTSEIFMSIRDDLPGTFNPGKHGTTRTERYANYVWEFVEYSSGSTPENQTVHWIGATRIKPDQQLIILAGGPKAAFEEYKPKFLKVLQSMTK